jgi:membrane fusion protein (multidrug efflux system)
MIQDDHPRDAQDGAALAPPVNGNGSRRRTLIAAVLVVFGLAVASYGAYWALVGRYVQSTDDAYVGGNIVQITPQVPGTVVAIGADDTQYVKAGQVLVRLDPADTEVALQRAKNELAEAVREVRNLFATTSQERAKLESRKLDLAKAKADLARRERLAGPGAISREEVQHARDAVSSAEAAVTAAEQQLVATRARVDGTTVDDHPAVQKAAAAVKEAYLAHARTTLRAPVSGFVAKRSVQLGQRVSPGAPLMAVVPLDKVWVNANFKEPQLADIRTGQRATVVADLYGGKVEYHGQVAGFGAGTGAAFALLPAQNASGNWIKIVQRVPVRIALDPQELAAHPLEIGLSMQVAIDTYDRSGPRMPKIAGERPVAKTEVFAALDGQAEDEVRAIIAANKGARVAAGAPQPGQHEPARVARNSRSSAGRP